MGYSVEIWEKRSNVRSRPLRRDEISRVAGLAFSPCASPISNHPLLIADTSLREAFLGYMLCQYSHELLHLETSIVQPVCQSLALSPDFNQQQRVTARCLLIDEAYHSLGFNLLIDETKMAFDLDLSILKQPSFLTLVQCQTQQFDQALVYLLACCVLETVICGKMSKLTMDTMVAPRVRQLFSDHVNDESKHGDFFAEIFKDTWFRLTTYEQEGIGSVFPHLLFSLIMPNMQVEHDVLLHLGFDDKTVQRIMQDTYASPPSFHDAAYQSGQKTLRMMQEMEVFSLHAIADAFAEHGMTFI